MDVVPKNQPRVGRALVLVVAGIFFAALYVSGLFIFRADTGEDSVQLHAGNLPADHLTIHLRVTSIDPAKQTVGISLEPEPTGTLTGDDGFTAKKDISFDVTTMDIAKTVTIKAGDPMTALELAIPIDGDIAQYPFDSYGGDIQLTSDLPLLIDSASHIQAYHADATTGDRATPESINVIYTFTRSHSILLFALFVYLLIALVALVAVVVTIHIVWGGYELQFGHVGWLAALLFVLPAVRSGLPGQPPIGTLCDFLVFFWAEFLVVASLVTLVFTWRQRSKPAPTVATPPQQ
jgi:hypothetical protein